MSGEMVFGIGFGIVIVVLAIAAFKEDSEKPQETRSPSLVALIVVMSIGLFAGIMWALVKLTLLSDLFNQSLTLLAELVAAIQ